ncbi:MAG: hypothetical protein R6X21_07030 [Candidatus Aminicenantes bacterium]
MRLFDRLRAKLKPFEKLPVGFYKFRRPDGGISIVDQMTVDYLRSTAPAPCQESLDVLFRSVRKVRVYKGGSFGKEPGGELLLEADGQGDFDTLSEALRIKDGPAGHCMCFGDPTIELLGESSERLAIITCHHGHMIRWGFWKDDAELINGPLLLDWLAARGVSYPLEDFHKDRLAAAERDRDWQRWLEKMPLCLNPFVEAMAQRAAWASYVANPVAAAAAGPNVDIDPNKEEESPYAGMENLHAAMRATYPDGTARALALFGWYGSGKGVWTGFCDYERIADKLLLGIPEEDLVSALSRPDLSEFEMEGGARFLCGHDARCLRDAVLNALSGDTQRILLEQALQTADKDKEQRARWFLKREPVG